MHYLFLAAALAVSPLTGAAFAATVGLPIIRTAPVTINFVNEFGDDLEPTPSYTMSFSGLIGAAPGAAALVGKPIEFRWFFDGGFDPGLSSLLRIDGISLLADPGDKTDRFSIDLPVETEVFDPLTGLSTFVYSAPFSGFGPRIAEEPLIDLVFSIDMPVPTKEAFIYCSAAGDCEFSGLPGLTEIGGVPVTLDRSYFYPEGRLDGAIVTFSTVGGPPAPVPLPATGGLIIVALGLLFGKGIFDRRRALA